VTLDIGQTVYYRGRGPCRVGAIVRKVVCGASAQFYSFSLLDESGTEFLVPVDKWADLPLRPLLDRHQIPKLLRRLNKRVGPARDLGTWKQRESFRSKLFASGSAFDLAELVESLTRSSAIRNLATDEWEAMRRARKLLICEIAAVMNESNSAAESRIDSVASPDSQAMKRRLNKLHFVEAGRKTT
jgi:RNA polymerase-interacting CarD/CdnL/TRCF family regulator